MKTFYTHDKSNGHQAKTEVNLNAKQVLVISTTRSLQGRLVTRVQAHWFEQCDGYRSLRHAYDFGTGGGDFSYLFQSQAITRLTEKLVQQQHKVALVHLADFVQKANEHYTKPEAPKAEMFSILDDKVEA
jgi:hypothetical protein